MAEKKSAQAVGSGATDPDKELYLADELLLLNDSGEIPEVALHGSLYYLTEDPEGPALTLDRRDRARLKERVVARYRTILLRDLIPANRDKPLYRGLARCVCNWQRLQAFCRRERLEEALAKVRQEVADALAGFLRQEVCEVEGGERQSSVNCGAETLARFSGELGMGDADLPTGWQRLCPEDGLQQR